MAGRPQRRNAIAALAERGGPKFVVEFIGGGGTMTELAQEVGWNRVQLSTFLNSDPEYAPHMDLARRTQAEAMADETLQIADNLAEERIELRDVLDALENAAEECELEPDVTARLQELVRERLIRRHVSSEEVQAAKVRIDTRKWMAALNDPDRFAPKPAQTNVQINVGALHLDALRRKVVPGDDAKVIGP